MNTMDVRGDLLKNVLCAVQKFLCKVHGTQDDHNYSPTLHVLYQNHAAGDGDEMNDTTPTSNNTQVVANLLWTLLEELQEIADCADVLPKKVRHWMDNKRPTRNAEVQTDARHDMNDAKFVQITCDNNEFKRRVKAFMKRKRAESDAFNRREFCTVATKPNEVSCARTNAVYVSRQTRNSLLRIERVRNTAKRVEKTDPRMVEMKVWPPTHPSSSVPYSTLPTDLKERISNLNDVLSEGKGDTSEHWEVYTKIRDLESRVMYLESVSPEYFHQHNRGDVAGVDDGGGGEMATSHGAMIQQQNQQQHSPLMQNNKQDNMLLDLRIKELQEKLSKKAKEMNEQKVANELLWT